MENITPTLSFRDKMKIQLSKNGILISNLVTNMLLLKNLSTHHRFVQLYSKGRLLGEKTNISPYFCLINLLKEHLELLDEDAVIQNEKITYNELIIASNNLANYLHSIGSQKGENISICADSFSEGIIAFFAMNKLGLVNARVFNGSKEKKMKYSILNFNSKTIFIDENNI